jgi:hypothetical protein
MSRPLLCSCWGLGDYTICGDFHENVDNPVDRLRLLSLRAQIEAAFTKLPKNSTKFPMIVQTVSLLPLCHTLYPVSSQVSQTGSAFLKMHGTGFWSTANLCYHCHFFTLQPTSRRQLSTALFLSPRPTRAPCWCSRPFERTTWRS